MSAINHTHEKIRHRRLGSSRPDAFASRGWFFWCTSLILMQRLCLSDSLKSSLDLQSALARHSASMTKSSIASWWTWSASSSLVAHSQVNRLQFFDNEICKCRINDKVMAQCHLLITTSLQKLANIPRHVCYIRWVCVDKLIYLCLLTSRDGPHLGARKTETTSSKQRRVSTYVAIIIPHCAW